MRGKKPLPSVVKLARGGRYRHPPSDDEPRHAAIEVGADAPDELTDPAAIAEWRRVIDTLSRGHVTTVDRPTLIAYCTTYADWCALKRKAAIDGFTTISTNGYPIPNPLHSMANKALVLLVRLAAELGLTPSSRSRVQQAPYREPKPGTKVDEFTAWQRKRRNGL